jgi:phosphoribosylanthranilate isomerase
MAVALGASYVGVIFAGGPRQVTVEEARRVLEPTRESARIRRVGVFGEVSTASIADVARVVAAAGLDVVQLSADPDPETVDAVRSATRAEVWAGVRCGSALPPIAESLFRRADAVLLDARVEGKLGGTGQTLPWDDIAPALRAARKNNGRLVLAGGLTPGNVRQAVDTLAPDVVDVSSGIESAPGVKDHERMKAFVRAIY